MVSDRVSLPGYRFVGLKIKNVFYRAKTFFGHDVPDDWSADGFTNSQLQWELHFRRAIGPSFVRLFLPLASAMAAVIFSLIVSFKVSAQKIGIPASILLVLAVRLPFSRKLPSLVLFRFQFLHGMRHGLHRLLLPL